MRDVFYGFGVFVLIIFFIAIISAFPILKLLSGTQVEDCVVKAERVVSEMGRSSRYMVFGKKEVYENVDSIFRGKFNSADFYRDIEPGKCYKFMVEGWRVPYLSMNRNIYQIVK